MDELTIAFKIESPPSWLPIGRTAENNWRTVEIDCSYWFNMNANGEVVLMYKPSCGMSPYPLLTERDGDNIIWRPKSGELVEGVGRLQAFFEVGTDVIGSSDMISCEVDSSLLGVDPGTDPGQTDLPWALDIIEQIAELSGHYPKIIDGVLYVWDSEIEEWVQFEGGSSDAVLYTPQTLTGAQKAQARENIGAGTYSKPSGGIPGSDIASGVIPSVPQMATNLEMEDWSSGKTVDAAVLQTVFSAVGNVLSIKANASDVPDASTSAPVMDGTAAVGTSDAYARADHVHPSDTTRLATTGNAYRTASIPMGHLDSTSTATVMTATADGITELRDGVCMWLRNGVITSASGFTLNVNGLGAKPCYSSLAAESRSTTIFNVNYALLMIYNSTRVDGGCWDIVYGVDTNTTYTPVKLGFGYGTCTTAAATAAKTASISSYALTAGGIVSIKFDNDVPAGATLNITSKGAKAIYHRGAAITAGVIKAGDTATFVYSTYYHLIAIDRDESGDVLPSVTASDNGKVLGVVNGAWSVKTDEAGSTITVDDALSTTSTNPVQNKVVKAALDGKADASALAAKQDALTAGQNVTISGNTISADVDSAEIAADVTDWLDANVTPVGSAVVVDSSLSVSGAAADAKVTGDLAKPISDAVALPVLVDVNNFEIGTYWGASSYPTYGSTLNKGTDTNTIRTIDPIYIPSGYTINTHGKLNIRLISVVNSQYSQVVNYSASGAVYTVESTGYYHICFQLVKSNGTISSVESALDGVEISTSPSIAEDVAALKADNAVLGVDGFLLTKYSAFQLGGLSSGNITTSTTRICTTDVCIADEDLNLHINSGFRIGVHTYKADGTFERDSGWIAGEAFYQIPQGKKFRVVMTPVTEYTIYNAAEAIPEMVSNVQCNRLIDEMPLMREMVDTTVYPYATETANHISTKKQAYLVDTVSFDATMPYDSYSIPQDIACYDGKLFVAHNKTGGKCITIQNADTGALVATVYSEDLNHANVISFGSSFFDSSDPYPLLYVSTENSNRINVFRITNSALTLVKTYAFADVGYYGNHCIDPVNNILYMIGYVQNTYNDGTNNFCIFSAYNLNSEIDNGNETYSAELMYRRRIPYIMTHQGNTFFGGNLFLLSSDYDQHNTKIYVLNTSGNIINILSDFPAPIPSRECEGITVVETGGKARLWMLDGSSKLYAVRFKD